VAVQGNLDPALLLGEPAAVARATRDLLESMRGRPGHIVNLGHGVPPEARLDCLETLVSTVRQFR
jgi:uroporphyrinogen decarboxylase